MPHIFNTLPQSLFFSQVVQTMGSIADSPEFREQIVKGFTEMAPPV
jgi:hypothetical protein